MTLPRRERWPRTRLRRALRALFGPNHATREADGADHRPASESPASPREPRAPAPRAKPFAARWLLEALAFGLAGVIGLSLGPPPRDELVLLWIGAVMIGGVVLLEAPAGSRARNEAKLATLVALLWPLGMNVLRLLFDAFLRALHVSSWRY